MEKRNGCTLSLYVGYFTLEKILLWFGGNVSGCIYCPVSTLNNSINNNNNNNNDDLEVAHPQSGSSSTQFLIELEFENAGFWGEGKTWIPGEKPLGTKKRTNNKLNPHMASTPGHIGGRQALSPLHHPLPPQTLNFNTVESSAGER